MRLLCVNNVGCPELEMGAYYTGEYSCDACKNAYYLNEIKTPNPFWKKHNSGFTRCSCGNRAPSIENDKYNAYYKFRFIELDDLHEIEEQEYSEQLENV